MKNQEQQEPRQAAVQTASSEDQDYIYTPVPQNKRYGWIKMFFVWLCWNVVVGDLATGTALGSSLNFRDALIALSIGDLVLIVMMICTVYIGSKTGLAAMSLVRFSVGRVGTYVFSAVICFTSVGWFATQLGFFGQIWSQYIPLSVPVLAVIGGIMMASTAIKGFSGMEKLSSLAAIPLLLFIVLALVNCLRLIGLDTLFTYQPASSQIGTIAAGITTTIGSWAAGTATVPDCGRFAKTDIVKISIVWISGLFFGHFLLPIAGIAAALHLDTWDFGVISDYIGVLATGSGLVGAVLITLAAWTTNQQNLYSASNAACNIIEVKKKAPITIVLAVIAIALGFCGVVDYFVPFMNWLGIVVPPMAAIMIADYLVLPLFGVKHDYNYNDISFSNLPMIKWPSMLAWASGVLIAIVTPGIQALNGVIATIVLHVVFHLAAKKMGTKEN